MKRAKTRDKKPAMLTSRLPRIPNIWNATLVTSEPQKRLCEWQVYRTVQANIQPELFGFHFVGLDIRGGHGAVSSKIVKFDPVTMSGTTISGRVYRLIGVPGVHPDGQYTLIEWAASNQVKMEDATAEFIRLQGIDLDRIRKAEER